MPFLLALKNLKSPEWIGAGSSAFFRLLGLVARFGLTLFIARYLGMRAMSSYGFVVAGSAGMVALSGVGLDYSVGRNLIDRAGIPAIAHFRDRLVLRCVISTGIMIASWLALSLLGTMLDRGAVFAALILCLEPIVYDLHQALISRRRPVSANIIIFIRSAAWIPIAIPIAYLIPGMRTINFIFAGWASGLLVSIVASAVFFIKRSLILDVIKTPIDWGWIAPAAKSAPIVYLSEVGTFGQNYCDRFVVGCFLGREAAGVYIFCWSLTNSVVPIIQAAVFHRLTPQLVLAWRSASISSWRILIRNAERSLYAWGVGWFVMFCVALSLGAALAVTIEIKEISLLCLMTVATIIRLRGELFHWALYSTNSDSDWIAVNLLGLVLAPPLSAIGVASFGLIGGGVQMICLSACLIGMRQKLLRLVVRKRQAQAQRTRADTTAGSFHIVVKREKRSGRRIA